MKVSLMILLSLVFMLALCSTASAQSQTFISAVAGSDGNPCTATLPCRTFTQALNVVQPRGEVVALTSGDYAPFSVEKPVSIYAAPGAHPSVVATSGTAVTIGPREATDVVTLRGLTLNGLGGASTGIRFLSGTLNLENCVVENFGTDGILIGADATRLSAADTVVRSNRTGFSFNFISTTSRATIERCRVERSTISAVAVLNSSQVTVRGSVLSGNGSGVRVIVSGGAKAELNLEDSLVTDNLIGLNAEREGALIRVANSTIVNNEIGLDAVTLGAIISRRNNTVEANTTNGVFTGFFSAR